MGMADPHINPPVAREERLRARIDDLTDQRDFYKARLEATRLKRDHFRALARYRGESMHTWRERYFGLRWETEKERKR